MKAAVLVPAMIVLAASIATVLAVRTSTAVPASTAAAALPLPPASPFAMSIAGTGLVEPVSESLPIGTELAGVVTQVPVTPGQRVRAGDVLFRLDDRDALSRLNTARAELRQTRERRARLDSLPRAETVPPLRAAVDEARIALESALNDLRRLKMAGDGGAVPTIDTERQQFAVRTGEARLARMQAELDLLLAGSWPADVRVLDTEVEVAEAKVRQVETELDRMTIRTPISGQVLERNVRQGQFAEPRTLNDPLIVIGDTSLLHIRVDIDETEAWRFIEGSPAVAMVRGNPSLQSPVTFVRAEPAIAPKRSLTGASTERSDTRVLRVIYALQPDALPVRVGQLLDVRIQAPSSEPARPAAH